MRTGSSLRGISFNWPRYWLPREHEKEAWAGPFLYDPEDKYGHIFSKHAKRLDQLADRPLLVLLGEPSAGKSTAVRQRPATHADSERGWEVLDLREYGTASELVAALNDISARIAAGELILDSADESPINMLGSTVASWLASRCPPGLKVRVAMRTSAFTPAFEADLSEAARQRGADLGVWVLAPLRQEDVQEAAGTLGFDADAFHAEIYRVGATHYAVLAGRLCAMARAFHRDGSLAGTQWEMHEKETRALVDSERATIGPAYRNAELGLDESIRLLARIAAVSILSGKGTLWVDRDLDAPQASLRIGDFVDPSDQEAWGDGTKASEVGIGRALRLGPFRPGSSAGEVVWSQRPVAEFLAAKYILDRDPPLAQIKQLLVDADTGRIPPQLHGLAAMLCSKPGASGDIIAFVAENDPHVAIRGDLPNMEDADRRLVAERLLKLSAEGGLTYSEYHLRGQFHRLKGPYLPNVLRPTILDEGVDEYVREIAVEIAEECSVSELGPALASVALGRREPLRVRISCAYALSKMGSHEDRLSLLPLLDGEEESDPDHDVRGCALQALWPDSIGIGRILDSLVPTSNHKNFGYYSGFVKDFVEGLHETDLLAFLEWAGTVSRERFEAIFRGHIDDVLARSFSLIADARVREGLAPMMVRFVEWKNRNGGWRWLLENTHAFESRFALVRSIRQLAPEERWPLAEVLSGDMGLLREEDFLRLLELAASPGEEQEDALFFAQRVGRFWDPDVEPSRLHAVVEYAGLDATFDERFSFVWKAWDLNDPNVKKTKEDFLKYRHRRRDTPTPRRRKGVPDPRPKRRRLLKEFEGGKRDAFWQLLIWLVPDRHGWERVAPMYADIKSTPGWTEESPNFRRRLIDAAEKYVAEGRDRPEEWLGRPVLHHPDAAGCRAVRLLRSEGRNPGPDAYRSWSVAIAAFPGFHSDGEHEAMIEAAALADPDRTESALLTRMTAAAHNSGYIALGGFVRKRLSGPLGNRLLTVSADWPFRARLSLLREALIAHSPVALGLVRQEYRSATETESVYSLVELLVLHGEAGDWEAFKERIESDEAFGERWLSLVSGLRMNWNEQTLPNLTVEFLEWLFGWIEERHPSSQDEHPAGVFSPTPRYEIQKFRYAILASLWERGSAGAVQAIERLRERFPEVERMDGAVLHARLRALEKGWEWIAPAELRKLLRDPMKVLVRNDADLFEAVLASLKNFDAHLRRTGMSWALWNEGQEPKLKPEERFSDLACEWLRTDLARIAVLPNREVQPRRDERWDILVEVRSAPPVETVYAAVVVEAKLAENADLWAGMEAQLLGRYLANSGLRYGIYLVGYPFGDGYPEPDRMPSRPSGFEQWRNYWKAEALRLSSSRNTLGSAVVNISLSRPRSRIHRNSSSQKTKRRGG